MAHCYNTGLKGSLLLATIFVAAAFLFACATQPHPESFDPPGFWFGLLQGFTIVFSLIGSIFKDVRIYALPNSGGWYDLGYVLGAVSFLGGSGAGARYVSI
jgi:hypothetical protein